MSHVRVLFKLWMLTGFSWRKILKSKIPPWTAPHPPKLKLSNSRRSGSTHGWSPILNKHNFKDSYLWHILFCCTNKLIPKIQTNPIKSSNTRPKFKASEKHVPTVDCKTITQTHYNLCLLQKISYENWNWRPCNWKCYEIQLVWDITNFGGKILKINWQFQ